MTPDRLTSPLPDDAPALAAELADALPGILETTDAAVVVACWTDHEHGDGEAVAVVTLGSPHVVDGPIFQVTVRRAHPADAERLRRHLGEAHDTDAARFWDESPEAFRTNVEAGHLYDGYHPWSGGPGWGNREQYEARHAAWQQERCSEDGADAADALLADWERAGRPPPLRGAPILGGNIDSVDVIARRATDVVAGGSDGGCAESRGAAPPDRQLSAPAGTSSRRAARKRARQNRQRGRR